MKKRVLISFIVLLVGISNAQQNTFNKDAELQRFVERDGKVEETSPNIYKLTYPDGLSRVYNLNRKENTIKNLEDVDTTIINIWEIDTTRFSNMFTYWQTVQVANKWWHPVFIDDLNVNNLPELYGYSDYWNIGPYFGGPVRIFERDLDGIYKNIFTYDSTTLFVQGMGDIHRAGSKEILVRSHLASNGVVFRSDSVSALPTNFDFIFYYEANQINNMTFGDWDNNGITDFAFIDGAGAQHCIIGEYRDSINNFEGLFQFSTTDEGDLAGFAIDDFDQDEKTEFVVGSGRHGNIYVIENGDENEYSLKNQFSFPTYNAYMQTVTNDIDGNGKTEFWIGGQDFEEGITVYQCYESNGDMRYKAAARIELRYSVSLATNYIQAVDIDDDGKEELIISSGNIILILKFVGFPGEHHYKLLYAKIGEDTQPGAEFLPVAIATLDGDEKKDILLPFYKTQSSYIFAFSYILRQNSITGVELSSKDKEEVIYIYPNPFNSICTISFSINEISNVQLKIFNTLGKEITLLLDRELSPGKYDILWNAKDKYGNSLPSGVYLIVLKTNNSFKTNKTVLLK